MPNDIRETLTKFAESLEWTSRRIMVDVPIARLTGSWELRFAAQGRYFISNGIPKLTGLVEARAPKGTAKTIDAAISTLDLFTFAGAVNTYNETIPEVFTAGAMQTVRDAGALKTYTVTSDQVLNYLQQHSAAKLGADVDATTKGIVRNVLVKGYEEGWTRAKIVKEVKSTFAGFSVADASPLYKNRAEVIAVNELGTAYSQGALQSGIALQGEGLNMQKMWAISSNACALCQGNAAEGWIPIGQDFASGHDAPTGHPRCRCALLTRAVTPASF